MDFIALAGANCLLRRRVKGRRLWFIAFLSSIGTLIITLTVTEPFCRAILIHFLLNTGMVVLCFGKSSWREFLENWAVIYLMVLFLGGVMELLKNSAAGMTFFWIQAVIAALILSVVTWYLGRRKQFGNQLFPVTLVHRGHAMEIMGYWDSGNQLRDPYDHRPVCILSRHMAAKILNPKKDRVHFIPYCSLGQKEGLLPVTEIACIIIQNGRHEVEIRPAAVGIANEGLLEGKEYDMILHASMLESRERGTKYDHETCTAKI